MSSGRDAILSRVRGSLKASGGDDVRQARVKVRLADHPNGVIPARGHLKRNERIALFRAMAEKANATVTEVRGHDAVPGAVMTYLRDRNLPSQVRMGADPRLAAAPWAQQKTLEVKHGPSDGNDLTAVSHAIGGIAETGTLALTSGRDNPTTLNLLPEHHIVVVSSGDIVPDLETLWPGLRPGGRAVMPRTVNLVTGPSRSGDIEQVLLLGAHGPRSLHIVIVED